MVKLNLGCGVDIRKGYINLDKIQISGVDVVWDINKFPYPFKKDSIDEIYASHVLEHVNELERVMEELKRICKNKAKVKIRVPHFSCGVSYRDPTHKRLFSYFTFDYFTKKCFYGLPEFKIKWRKLNFTREAGKFLNFFFNPILNLSPAIYERFGCWIFPCAEILIEQLTSD